MNLVQRVERWGDTHHPAWTDALRIVLGLVLFMKGVTFIYDADQLISFVGGVRFSLTPVVIVHCIIFAHLVGGLMIALGAMTRLMALIQIPILVGAVFFVNMTNGLSFLNSELWLSLIVLALLMLFLVIGSGRFSMDEAVRRNAH